MKKIVTLTFILLSACTFFINQKSEKTSAQENIRENESLDYSKQIIDDFSDEFNSSNWYISHRVWGESSTYDRYNGGVIPENVYHDSNEGVVSFVARGNEYAKNEVLDAEIKKVFQRLLNERISEIKKLQSFNTVEEIEAYVEKQPYFYKNGNDYNH